MWNLASTYKCPICGEDHNTKNSVIIKQEIDRKFLNRKRNNELSTYRLKVYEENYLVKYHNIRICPKCAKKRKMHFIYAAVVILLGIVALLIRNLLQFPTNTTNDVLNSIFIAIIPGGIMGAFIFFVICVLIAKSHIIDVEKAKRYNAIAQEESIFG